MCSGFQAGSKRCRAPRANAGDARLAAASNPLAIGASFINRPLRCPIIYPTAVKLPLLLLLCVVRPLILSPARSGALWEPVPALGVVFGAEGRGEPSAS